MKKYIGTKVIEAEPMIKDGNDGYEVVYDNPNNTKYKSWSPKEVFERAYTEADKDKQLVREKLCDIFSKVNTNCMLSIPQTYVWEFLNMCEQAGITFNKETHGTN